MLREALLDTTAGWRQSFRLGDYIEPTPRPKYVLRDIDEGDTYIDEVVQTVRFLEHHSATIRSHPRETRPSTGNSLPR